LPWCGCIANPRQLLADLGVRPARSVLLFTELMRSRMTRLRALQIVLAAGWTAVSAAVAAADAITPSPESDTPTPDADLWFPVGERIEYRILWGRIPVALSTANSEWVDYEGRRLLAIRFETRSNAVLSKLYPVDDFIESLIDPQTFLPVQFTKRLNEGHYHCDETTVFDHARGVAVYTNNRKQSSREYEIDPDTRDLISFMYSMRTVDLMAGSEQDFRVMADEKLYDLTIKAEKQEEVKLPHYGKIDSMQLEPEAAFQGLFVRKGKMTVWVSEDDRKVITKASIKVPVAHVNLVLDKVTGPGDDEWVATDVKKKMTPKRTRRKRQ